ncbi:MAG: PHP domain-containing protein [Oscillospiraceae bacterium]|nr:PHP domain-containing protein [Oscillospiraceae bacterium]
MTDETLSRPFYVNNHIHTTYSFSPFTPTQAAHQARLSGLATAGIMDHDSVSGAEEFLDACRREGVAGTVGFECRCRMGGTPFEDRRINNPDQPGVAYVACHGIPRAGFDAADKWLAPYRAHREDRNRRMVDRLNAACGDDRFRLSYDDDVRPLSMAVKGGSVTERHICCALTNKLIERAGTGAPLKTALESSFGMIVDGKNESTLLSDDDPYYNYRVLGVLKSALVERFYVDADEECPHIAEFIEFAHSIGAVPAYPYLGDVGDSVTGDKKAQAFEDAYLDQLIGYIADIGFDAVTYMPTRNTMPQLKRLISLCGSRNLLQICGEDINTPFQSFICEKLALPEFSRLIDAAWALIGHERASDVDPGMGMFSPRVKEAIPALDDRAAVYATMGKVTMLNHKE